jgi:hypothetical protein
LRKDRKKSALIAMAVVRGIVHHVQYAKEKASITSIEIKPKPVPIVMELETDSVRHARFAVGQGKLART